MAALAFDRSPFFELAVACEVFGIDRSAMGVPNYRFFVCAAERSICTSVGFSIDTPNDLSTLSAADTIIVPAWRDVEERPPERLLDALRIAHERGARIASLCSGAFVLAAAGLLDGRRATTHWMFADRLAEAFPAVRVDPSVLYVDEGSVLTAAGTAAAIDLCLHMVRLDYGAEVANVYARRMVVAPHRDGAQAQYVEAPVPSPAGPSPLATTLSWALERLDEPLTVDRLAARSRLSSRTFARRFRSVTGTTPIRWVIRQRVIAAQRMLEMSDDPIEQVAQRCGFGSAGTLRFHFSRVMGVSPNHHRRVFRQRHGE